MNNNIDLENTPSSSSNIYISEHLESDIKYSLLPIIDGNTQITEISCPFSLSTSIRQQKQMRYRNKTGFTGQSGYEYARMGTLTEFIKHARIDVSGSLFKDNWRGADRFIQSDVLIFDIDNYMPLQKSLMDDESLHLTIEKFTAMFVDYDFVISTSLNHKKQKDDASARDKFHVFMGLGRVITDASEIEELIQKVDYFIKSHTHDYGKIEIGSDEDYSLIDGAIGENSQIWGNEDTTIYYNKGGSIYDLLYQETFSNNYSGYTRDSGKHRNRRFKENQTAVGDYELNKNNLLTDWDYVNIISRKNLNHFYDIAYKTGTGYFMGYCKLHDDDEASLQIFENGGYNCLGCGKKGISALGYESEKTGESTGKIRNRYIKELKDITKQDFLIWLDDNNKLKKDTADGDDDSVDEKLNEVFDASVVEEGLNEEDRDEYFLFITKTGSMRANKELYEILGDMNKKHAILSHSGQIKVMCRETSRNSEYKEFVFPSIDDFKKRYKNERYLVRKFDKKNKPILSEMDIGTAWELWEHRRQYDGIDFYPYDDRSNRYDDDDVIWDYWDDWESATQENGYMGESVKRGLQKFMDIGVLNGLSTITQDTDALQGCNQYIHHLRENILGNYKGENHARFLRYLISWMSKTLTHHGKDRIKIVPVLKGRQGCGKGIMASRYGELFGKHFLHIQNSNQVGQRFNMQMMDALLVYVNEAVFAGNKETMNQLKGLITEDEIQLEQKYLPAFMGKSHLRFIYSSNEDWVVPIEWDNRRYWMLECGDFLSGTNKADYFDNLMKQWNMIGRESLYKYLTSDKIMDMAAEVRFEIEMPQTSASSHQLIQTDDVMGWINSVLEKGGHYIYDGGTARTIAWAGKGNLDNRFSITDIMADYVKFNRDRGITYKSSSKQLSERLGVISKQMGWGFNKTRITKILADSDYDGGTTVWDFDNIDKITEIWVKELFNGSFEEAGFATESSDNLDDFTDGKDDDLDMPEHRKNRFKDFNFDDVKVD